MSSRIHAHLNAGTLRMAVKRKCVSRGSESRIATCGKNSSQCRAEFLEVKLVNVIRVGTVQPSRVCVIQAIGSRDQEQPAGSQHALGLAQ